jgi:hypothetical protein
VAGHEREAELPEELAQQLRVRRGVLDELEPVGAHRVLGAVGLGHGGLLGALGATGEFYAAPAAIGLQSCGVLRASTQ